MKKVILFSLLITLITVISAFAGGNELGNGGDLVAQEFVAAGKKLVEELKAKPDPRIPNIAKFAEAVETTKVSTADSLTLHGKEVDAINYPEEKHIDVSRSRWKDSGPGKRASLVLHEYLGLIGVEDQQYEISSSYADAFKSEDEKPKNFNVAVRGTYGRDVSPNKTSSKKPGIGGFVGYNLSNRSTLGLSVLQQTYSNSYGFDNYESLESYFELAVNYRYWLSLYPRFRPYVMGGFGLAQESYDYEMKSAWYVMKSRESYSQSLPTLQIGLGMRHPLLREIGLDVGLNFHKIMSKGFSWTYRPSLVFAHAGIDVPF